MTRSLPIQDIPSPIDLCDPKDATEWAAEADKKRPWRKQVREEMAGLIAALARPSPRIIELGSGPGLLAEQILSSCDVTEYTLFDFSPPMLEMARERLCGESKARYIQGSFKDPSWPALLGESFDAAVAQQALHEIRHKSHLPGLYRQVLSVLEPEGVLLVCDHNPMGETERSRALYATSEEQIAFMKGAGFADVQLRATIEGLYLVSAHRP